MLVECWEMGEAVKIVSMGMEKEGKKGARMVLLGHFLMRVLLKIDVGEWML